MIEAINNYLRSHSTPIIEDGLVTFVWKGRTAPALVGDFTGWDDGKPAIMEKCSPGTWIYKLALPQDAYIEYGFLKNGEPLLDPNNPRNVPNGIGGYNNYFSMPGYKRSTLNRRKANISHGMVSKHELPTGYLIAGKKRTIHLYHPATQEAVPLVVVWDGQDYLYRMRLNNIVDTLISQGRVRPIAMAFIDNAGQDLRTPEYACSDATLAFMMLEVLPLVKTELNLVNIELNPGAFGVLGASMGGLMALYTGVRIPYVFGNVLSQSGAFAWGDFDMVVFDLLNQGENRPIKIWMDVGLYDLAGLLEANRRMQQVLNDRGYPLTYREYPAGHNYPAWTDDVWRGLEALFPSQ